MAYRIKQKKVNRKFLYNVIKAQQLRINNLHEILASAKTGAEKQAEEFRATIEELKPVIDERNALRNIIKALVGDRVSSLELDDSQSSSQTPQPESVGFTNVITDNSGVHL